MLNTKHKQLTQIYKFFLQLLSFSRLNCSLVRAHITWMHVYFAVDLVVKVNVVDRSSLLEAQATVDIAHIGNFQI